MNNQIVTDPTKKVKYIKPAMGKGAINPPSDAGFWLEVARVEDPAGEVFGVADSPDGLICQCRPLLAQLDDEAQPCRHALALAIFNAGEVKPFPL